jgi:two-component system, NarL family, response regulator DegU
MRQRKAALSMQDQSTAVLLDEHPLWLEALERILDEVEVTPVGRATRPAEALELVAEHRPTLFVLDVEMNGFAPDGLTCLREAIAKVPTLKAIVVSGADDQAKIDAAFGAGAAAYVLKRARPEDLASAFRQVFSRSLYLAHGRTPVPLSRTNEADEVGLTRREKEILQLVAEGGTNGDVARRLWVTEQTVKFHLANIFRKLDVTNRTQASRWAHAHGLLEADATQQPASSAA